MQTHPQIMIMRIFPFGKWLFEASPGGWMQVLGCSASKSTDVTDTIKSEPNSEACKDPAGNMLFLQLTDQQRVHLWTIPGQTPRPPKALWIKALVWGVFQHLHSIYWSAGLVRHDWKKKKKSKRCTVVSDWQNFSCIFMWIPTTEHVHTALANPISTRF